MWRDKQIMYLMTYLGTTNTHRFFLGYDCIFISIGYGVTYTVTGLTGDWG